jgi:adenylosuccinate lyase
MKIISKRNPKASLSEFFLKRIQDILVNYLSVKKEEIASVLQCLQEYVKHEENMQAMIKASLRQENLHKIVEVMNQL